MRCAASVVLLALGWTGSAAAATVCNGYPALCSKPYSGVSVIGAHNSYTSSNTNLAANQDYGVTQQLTDGIRLLQNQIHLQGGVLRLCHTSCFLYDGGLLTDYLKKVKTWMDANPDEVVTILLVNIDNQPASTIAQAYVTAGLDALSFTPSGPTIATPDWPTLGSMIDSGKRLVTFMDNTASFADVPYIMDEFSNMWESKFDLQTASQFDCAVDRTAGGDLTGQMYLINHYLYTTSNLLGGATPVPNKAQLPITNGVSGPGSLGQVAGTLCPAAHDRPPTFMLVDFYEWGMGSVFEVAAKLNGVQYVAKDIAAQNGTDAVTSTGGGKAGTTVTTKNGAGTITSTAWSAVALGAFVLLGTLAAI